MRDRIKTRLNAVGGVLGAIAWRGFGLFLFILGGAAGTGAVVVGDWVTGVLIAWVTLMLGVVGALSAPDWTRLNYFRQCADAVLTFAGGRTDLIDFYLCLCKYGHGEWDFAGGRRAAAVHQLRRYRICYA